MTLTVHHLKVSQSERIPWLCEELGIPYELKLWSRSPVFSPPELKAMTPLGAAPVIEDTSSPYSEASPLVMSESAAIAEYIAQKHGGGRLTLPVTHKDYADFLYWFHLSNGNLQPAVSALMTASRLAPSPEHPAIARLHKRIQDILKMMDDRLAKVPYLAGEEFTTADIMTVFSLTTMRRFAQYSLAGSDNVLAWLQRCASRPGYKAAREKCDPEWPPAIEAEVPELFGPLKQFAQPPQSKA